MQASVCTRIATDNGWTLVHEPWKESFSGRKNTRPVFQEILAFLDSRPGDVRYYLFRSIDRFTRGGSFAYEQMKRELARRGVEMIDSFGVIQPTRNTLEDVGFEYEWSRTSPSEISEIVMATSAKHEVTSILTRLVSQEIRLTQRGYKMRSANDGYVNEKVHADGKRRTIQRPDPERAKYFIAMFKLRASGSLSDDEICDRVNSMGYRTKGYDRWDMRHERVVARSQGKLLDPKGLQRIIQRPIYCGVVCEKWTRYQPIKAAYSGLIPIGLFNAANRGKVFIREQGHDAVAIFYDHYPEHVTKQRSHSNRAFPFKNVILCPHCRKPLLGSSPRGKSGAYYPIYHCARKHKYFGVSKTVLETAMKRFVGRIRFHIDAYATIRTFVVDAYKLRQAEILEDASFMGHAVAELEAKKAEAIRAFKFATTDLMRRSLEEEADDADRQIRKGQTVRNRLELTERDIEAYLAEAKLIMEHPSKLLENPSNPRQKLSTYALFFDELPTYQEIVDGTPKVSFIFKVSSNSETPESMLVSLQRLEWNTIEAAIAKWKQVRLV